MDSDTFTYLLTRYIQQHRKLLPFTLNSYLKEDNNMIYRYIIINYNSNKIEVKVYNSNFIVFKVNNHPKNISVGLKQARDTIHSIFEMAHNHDHPTSC
jgi:hypothetical protein